MAKRRALLVPLLMAVSQVLPAPFLPAMAQQAAPSCLATPLRETQSPPSMNPPLEWQSRSAGLAVTIRQDGTVQDVTLVKDSGAPDFNAAAVAHVKDAWRWRPLACASVVESVSIHVPTISCVAQSDESAMPMLPIKPLAKDVAVILQLGIGPSGRVNAARILTTSGDGALDAQLVAHVRANWRYYPVACGNTPGENDVLASARVTVHLPHVSCDPRPLPETQTAPEVDFQDRPRSTELQVGVVSDGTVQFANVTRSSGDAALDAAAAAHVKQAWRWQPFSCPNASQMVLGSATVAFPYAVVDPPAR